MTDQAQSIDLADLDTTAACDKGAEIELVHPVTRAPLGIFWGVLGRDSTAVQEHTRARYDADMRKAAQARKRGKDVDLLTQEQQVERGIELLVAASTHWRTGSEATLKFEGEKLAFSKANATRVLQRMKWIRDQIDEAAADLENFMKA